ncbi:MAG: iron-sulfur cluster repair di-iron protein [Syntrophus sp. PtaU1.Bin005]|jgi:hemerythrin-like domain-containing protein|uniref:hemerythrin domain-containing protein n=1 Tax=Syntrophus TaxID=43773 RepID=UPI0009CD0C96|nr:MAG: iron-sulfur cluster repair di-iron protein [Syntrophus sp. PtaB.Bin138]OPY83335.1 MAG: iron-sulfur cluster repair di-iron protein [Syntrophus sp. PtaU1.Bin005]
MKATQQLRNEHEGVKVMLIILEQVCRQLEADRNLNEEHFDGILEFLKVFVDKCHHGKEEDLLFPALTAAGIPEDGPIAVMLQEHEMGRNYVKSLSDYYAKYVGGDQSASKTISKIALAYIALLRNHIEKENDVLFVMADRLLSEQKQDELYEGFERIEEERIGAGKHEEFHGLLKRLSRMYSI